MRVIAGEYKGRKLFTPKGSGVRPTADRVKEAIFSMVQPILPDAVCFDMFSGSGALGIEALSRGAARVYFCDNSPASIEALKENLDACRVNGQRAVVIAKDWRAAGARISEKCNLVFIDAPYNMCEHYPRILESLAKERILENGACIVIERDVSADAYTLPPGFEKTSSKRYGSVGVDLIAYTNNGDDND